MSDDSILGKDFINSIVDAKREVLGNVLTEPSQAIIGRLNSNDTVTTVVTEGEYGMVWARRPGPNTGDAIQAVNTILQQWEITKNRPVLIKEKNGAWEIVGKGPGSARYDANAATAPQKPIYRSQINFALITPNTTPNYFASYHGGTFQLNNEAYRITDVPSGNLESLVPGSDAISIKVELDPLTSTWYETAGGSFSFTSLDDAFKNGDLDTTRTSGRFLIGWIRLYDGQDAIELDDILPSEYMLDLIDDHGALSGLGDDDHTQYIIDTPGSDSRNVITPIGTFDALKTAHGRVDFNTDGATGSGVGIGSYVEFNPNPPAVPDNAGVRNWNPLHPGLETHSGLGPVLQDGREMWVDIYNDTGIQINNGQVLKPVSVFNVSGELYPTVVLAIANDPELAEGTLVIATMDIPNGTVGITARFGSLSDVDTSGLTPGLTAFLSATVAGEMTNTIPTHPDYNISLGAAFISHATTGQFFMSVTRTIFDIIQNDYNGSFSESFDFKIDSDGATVTGSIQPSGSHPNLHAFFSDTGIYPYVATPPPTITLTHGTDEIPVVNYVYIPVDTKVLTVSTVGFPADIEHIAIDDCVIASAATTKRIGGGMANQNHNDELASPGTHQGDRSHRSAWIRAQPASYIRNTGTDTTLVGTPPNAYIVSSPGDIRQLHRATMPPQDMRQYDIGSVSTPSRQFAIGLEGDLTSTFFIGKLIHVNDSTGNDGTYTVASVLWSDPIFIITVEETIPSGVSGGTIGDFIFVFNDPDTANFLATNLNYITKYSDGSTISNNEWFSVVIIAIRNKTGEPSFLGCQLPSDGYQSESLAIADPNSYSNKTIPGDYNGKAILVARFTVRKTVSGLTYNGGDAYEDLRPSQTAGGGTSGGGGGTMSDWFAAADTGTAEQITDSQTLTIAGAGDTTTAISGKTLTVTSGAAIYRNVIAVPTTSVIINFAALGISVVPAIYTMQVNVNNATAFAANIDIFPNGEATSANYVFLQVASGVSGGTLPGLNILSPLGAFPDVSISNVVFNMHNGLSLARSSIQGITTGGTALFDSTRTAFQTVTTGALYTQFELRTTVALTMTAGTEITLWRELL